MAFELSSKDRQLLLQLDLNCRQSNAAIGKKVGLSKEVVSYRVNKLLKEGIIRSFSTHINMTKAGYRMYKIYLQLQRPTAESEIINYLLSNPAVFWVASSEGSWGIVGGILLKDVYEFHQFISELSNRFSDSILRKAITVSISIPEFPKAHILGKENPFQEYKTFGGLSEEKALGAEDLLLLKTIANNARLSTTEIAKRTGLSTSQITYRIKKMKEEEIILSFRVSLDYEKAGLLYFKQFITLRNTTKEKTDSLIEYCRKQPNIVYLIFCVGTWDIEIDSEVSNYQVFNALVKDFKEKYSDIIMSHESVQISKEYRMTFIPGASETKKQLL